MLWTKNKRRPAGGTDLVLYPTKKNNLRLEPESGVEVIDGVTHAVSLPFWLRLEPAKAVVKRKWIKLRYSSSFFDEPVRPLIRFLTSSGKAFVQPMNGAILGSAEWIGRVPDDTVAVSVSPGRRLGPFSFRIDDLQWLSRRKLLRGGFFSDPLWVFWAIRSRFIDSRQEAWQSMKYALGGTPFNRYEDWEARMRRPLDLGGFDRPRADWTTTPVLRFFMPLTGEIPELRATLGGLRAQVYPRWSLHAIPSEETDPRLLAYFREQVSKDDRLFDLSRSASVGDFDDTDRVAVLHPGDLLPDYALAVIAETLADRPDLSFLYTDEDAIHPTRGDRTPTLKPDWSPVYHERIAYIGGLAFVRYGNLAAGVTTADLLADERTALRRLLARMEPKSVGHIRRILYHRARPRTTLISGPRAAARKNTPEPEWPEVSIIIPTRDHARLLYACTQGLKTKTDYPAFNVVIVDNGSTEPEARELLDKLPRDSRFRILDRPQPFNYAKLSNIGARETQSPMLLFLNNDIRMTEPGWLKAMVRWAMQPQIGVVGAKLLFPNGTVQHAGVVLGMGGISGHIYRRTPPERAGYLQQLATSREMSAVTGACIAVERRKFEAVGGFDAENLPVDLNDMDLCLKIAERGWTNLWAADAVLVHVQSASRGIERNPFDQYRRERTYFVERWAEVIRDDPYFHPAFSLSAHRPALA